MLNQKISPGSPRRLPPLAQSSSNSQTAESMSASGHKGVADEAHPLSKYGGPSDETRNTFQSMIEFQQKTADEEKPKNPDQVSVPVFLTVLVKNISTDENGGEDPPFFLNGTMVHRSLFLDMLRVSPIDTEDTQKTFKMRLNEGPIIDDACLSERKCVPTPIGMEGEAKTSTGPDYQARCTTSSFKLQMKKQTVFNKMPFQIIACEVYLELTSFVGEVLALHDPEVGVDKCDTLKKLLTKLKVEAAATSLSRSLSLSRSRG